MPSCKKLKYIKRSYTKPVGRRRVIFIGNENDHYGNVDKNKMIKDTGPARKLATVSGNSALSKRGYLSKPIYSFYSYKYSTNSKICSCRLINKSK